MRNYFYCAQGIIYKELLRFLKEKSRFFSALVRPLLWLFIFSAGFTSALGLAIIPPYESYITYETYIVPGLVGMILLFNGMQSSLTMIIDKEMGSMKILLTSYINRNFLLFCKMFATAIVSTIQAITFLIVAYFYGIELSITAIVLTIPVILFTSIVIFPMFFLSSALYPLWKIKDSSLFLYTVCSFNPFTYIVESIRFTLYLKYDLSTFYIIFFYFIVALSLAFMGYKSKNVLKKS